MAEDTSAPDVQTSSAPNTEPTPAERLAELKAMTFGFDGHPLEHFRGLSAEQIQAHGGIGAKFRLRIQNYLAELDQLEPPPPPPPPPAPLPNAPGVPLEPAAPGGGGLQLLVVVLLVVVLVLVSVFGTAFLSRGGRGLEDEHQKAQARLNTLSAIGSGSAELALEQSKRAYADAHDGNFGHALAQIDTVDAALAACEQAAAHGESSLKAHVGTARETAAKARVALKLEQAATKLDVEAACAKLVEAVQALKPTGESVHNDAGGQPEH